ncbi:MAG: recombinase family protein [Roseiflexus sp.]|nr:recombinase family protein [Roseiflexus sp.]
MKAIIYVRVSSDDQQDNNSLHTQREACLRYAMNHGMDVIDVQEDVMSGAVLDRPGLTAARQALRSGEAQALIVYSMDRLSRNSAHERLLRDEFRLARVQLHTVSRGRVLLRNPMHQFSAALEANWSEFERALFRERSLRGKIGKTSKGQVLGQGPFPLYGYRYEGLKRERRLVVNEEEAAIVRTIFARCCSGMGCAAIAASLDADGVPPPSVKRIREGHLLSSQATSKCQRWNGSLVHRILRHPAYRGEMVYNLARPDSETEDEEERVRITVSVPRIVPDDVWYAAQEQLAAHRVFAKRNVRRFYLLRGRLICACGYRLTGETYVKHWGGADHVYSSYRCHGTRKVASHRCDVRIRCHDIDQPAWQWICSIISDEAVLREAIATQLERLRASVADLEAQRAAYQRMIREADMHVDRLLNLYLRNIVTEEELTIHKRQYDDLKQSAQRELERIAEAIEQAVAPPNIEEQVLALTSSLRPLLPHASDEEKQRIVEALNISGRVVRMEDAFVVELEARLVGQKVVIASTERTSPSCPSLSNHGATPSPWA